MSLRKYTSLCSCLVVLAGFGVILPLDAQQAGSGQARVIPLGVYDKKGKLIPSLNAAQLHVRVGRKQVRIHRLSVAGAAGRIVLLLDVSKSLAVGEQWPGAGQLARALVSVAKAGDLFVLGYFSDKVQSLHPLTDNQPELFAALERLEKNLEKEGPTGPTALFDALTAGVEALARSPQFGDAVVVVTDGVDNASRVTRPKLRDKALQAGVRLFAMILPAPWLAREGWFDKRTLMKDRERFRKLVSDTGGASLESPDLRFRSHGGDIQPKPLLDLATELYWRIRTVCRVELELAKPVRKRTKVQIEVRDEQGREMKDTELSYPRYLLPLSTSTSGSSHH